MSGREFDIIKRFFVDRIVGTGPGIELGPGDDCALLRVDPADELCVSTDTLIEGVHFPSGADPEVAAARSLNANLSDLAAMGARPVGFTLALTLPGYDESWLDRFGTALGRLAQQAGLPLVGGNLARGNLSITLTVFGAVARGTAMLRSGSHSGDDIYVSGYPGDAAAGLFLLQADPLATGSLVERYRAPVARIALGQALSGLASAAIDVSDGLIADLGHIADSSRLGAIVNSSALRLSQALIEQFDEATALEHALVGGDDYELCFTAAPGQADEVARLADKLALPLTHIGKMRDGDGVTVLDADGKPMVLPRPGYQHFLDD